MNTRSIKQSEVKQEWYILDVTGVRLGKAAQAIAKLLIGKDKVENVDYLQTGDKVIVVNAKNIDVHSKKLFQKKYYTHSGFIGNLKVQTLEELLEKDPTKVIKKAVWGMLPKTRSGRAMLSNLRVYNNERIKEEAQQPQKVKLDKLIK
jgi:large subunit ribosomal protein L13